MFETCGKVALVTGALGGIGRCCVKALLQNGVKGVLLVDWSDDGEQSFVDELNEEFGHGKVYFAKADVSKEDQLKGAFDKAITCFNQLDIVVNNAGLAKHDHNLVIDVNLRSVISSTYLATREYLPSKAVILNVASISGLVPLAVSPTYTATKAGLVYFARSLKTLQTAYIKVLTLCPSFTKTRMANFLEDKPREEMMSLSAGLYQNFQSAESVGKAIVEVIKIGSHASVWVVNNDEPPVEVEFQEVDDCFKKQILQMQSP